MTLVDLARTSPAELREIAAAMELHDTEVADAAAHGAMLEAIGAKADPEASAALDRRAAVRAADPPEGSFEAVDDIVRQVLPDDECWALRGAVNEMARFTRDARRLAHGGLRLAEELGIDEQVAIRVVGLALRDLRLRGHFGRGQ